MVRKLLWVVPVVLALSAVGSAADANGEGGLRRKPAARPTQPVKNHPKKTHAPEFDYRASGAALALLLGGAWALSGRRRRGAEQG